MPKPSKIEKENVIRASQKLQVSEATIQNWLKAKLLKTLKPEELDRLKKKMAVGKVNRLNKRANKRSAHQNVHFHPELLSAQYPTEVKLKLDSVITDNFTDKDKLLFGAYLILLSQENLAQFGASYSILANAKILNELADWSISFSDKKLWALISQLQQSNVVLDSSVLAYVYQSSSSTGEKNIKGAYYTPQTIIQSELKEILKTNNTYCDPCCGGGAYLTEAYRQLVNLKSTEAHKLVYGFDLDKTAVLISRANLTLLSKGQVDVLKQIRCLNAITSDLSLQFDVIATNPPWGAEIANADLKVLLQKFNYIKSQESFSYFLAQSLNNLKPNAELSFILPESILNIKTHHDIRLHLLKNYKWVSVKEVSEKFSGVMTKVIALRIANSKPQKNNQLLLVSKEQRFLQAQEDYLKNSLSEISLSLNTESAEVIKLIEAKFKTRLKDNADWGLGIVTGNNEKYLKIKASSKTQPVLKGVDICRFQFNKNSSHLIFEPQKFQQMIAVEKFRTPAKLVYRFICKELVFAIDRKKQLTLNSANFVVPRLKTHSIESLCGLFNSKLAQYYFQKKFNTFKVLRYHLESFPIADFSKKQATEIDFLVRLLEKQFDEVKYQKLNQLVYAAYKLDKGSIAEIEKTTLSKAFIK